MDLPSLILQQVISKVIVDRTRIPISVYQKVEPLVDEFKKWGRTFEEFEIEEPVTWVKTGMKIVESLVERDIRRTDPIESHLHDIDYTRGIPDSMGWVGEFILEKCDLAPVIETDDGRLCKVSLDNGSVVYVTITGDQYEFDDLHLPQDKEANNECYAGLRDLFWSYNETVIIDADEDEFIVKRHEFPGRDFRGSLLNDVKKFRSYMDAGIRRVVVFQGKPGTGKSTLCEHAARLLSKKTVVLNNTILTHLTRGDWEEIIQLLKPDLVIVDDIDRTNARALETSLYLFEDTYYDVPLTLLTTNDQEKLPDAFRRPGRIDQIFDMPRPTEEIRIIMIDELAEREGLGEVPAFTSVVLNKVLEEHPAAYAVELMRRYKALGWDYRVPASDIVFGKMMQEIYDSLTRSHEVLDRNCITILETIGPEAECDD